MSLEFSNVVLSIGPQTGEPESEYYAYSDALSSTPLSVEACIKQFDIQFENEEHKFLGASLEILSVEAEWDNRVKVTYTGGLHDSSGDYDDEYKVTGTALVIAAMSDN